MNVLEVRLSAPAGSGILKLPHDAIIELWGHYPNRGSHRLAIAKIDYWNAAREAHDEVEIQGRSPCAVLIDQPTTLTHEGRLGELLDKVSEGKVRFPRGIPDIQVSAFVRAPSAYGAMRLIATSMGLLIQDDGDKFQILTSKAARENLRGRPVARISDPDILNANFRKGNPVRKR
ncbi:hypothetical protein WMF30_37175 [Sorangium sp. So ce134]